MQSIRKRWQFRTAAAVAGILAADYVGDAVIFLEGRGPRGTALEESPPSPRSLNAEMPEVLAALILRALNRDPADRPQSAALLFEELDAVAV